MKRLLTLAVLLLLSPISVLAQDATVTGNLKTVFGQNLGTRTFVRFRLRNYGANVPRVIGSGVIVPADNEGTIADLKPDSNGLVSGALYSNAVIDPTGTYYTVEFYYDGQFQHSCDFTIGSGTFDFTTETCQNIQPVQPIVPTQVAQSLTFTISPASTTWTLNHNFADLDTLCFAKELLTENRIYPDISGDTGTDGDTYVMTWVVPQEGRAVCYTTNSFNLADGIVNFISSIPGGNQSIANGFNLTLDGNLFLATEGQDLCASGVRCDLFVREIDASTGMVSDLLFGTDNAFDVGTSGATRPRRVYAATGVRAPAFESALEGGSLSIKALDEVTSGAGGGVTVTAGDANGVTNFDGGDITITGGAAAVAGQGGDITLSGGSSPSGTAGRIIFNSASTIFSDMIVDGMDIDFESGTSEGFPRLAQSTTPPSTACDEAAETGRLYYDTDADTDGSVFVCRGATGWKEIDDDGAGGGGNAWTTLGTAIADAPGDTMTVTDSLSIDIITSDDPEDLSAAFNYTNTLAGDPALNAEECVLTLDGTGGGGFLCEGTTANTNEQLYLFPAVDGVDTTNFIVVNSAQVTAVDGTALTVSGGTLNADSASSGTLGVIELDNALAGSASAVELAATVAGSGLTLNTGTTPDSLDVNAGAGIGLSGDNLVTASSETDFLTSGALTCGASTQGRAQVHTTPLQYCDNAGTPTLRYAAYGNSSGESTAAANSSVSLVTDVTGTLDESFLDANVVLDNASNTYTTGAQNFSSATSLTIPSSAGAAPTASGQVAYDTTAQDFEYGDNGTNRKVANLDEAQIFTNKTLDAGTATTTHAAGANFLQTLRHATDCTAITDGVSGELCVELDSEMLYSCQPTAGGCDTPGEWILTGDGGGGGFTSFNIDGDNNSPQTITDGEEALFVGGTGIVTTAAVTDQVTFDFEGTEIGTETWLDNADRTWTFDIAAAGTNPTIAFAASSVEVDANLTVDDEQELRLKEEDAGGENYVGFKAPAAVTSNGICTLLDSTTDIVPDTCVGGILADELIALGSEVTGTLDQSNMDANVVMDNESNTYSTGAQNFAAATSLTLPTSAGAAPTASGQAAYDSTANAFEYGDNGTNRTVANLDEAQTFTNKTADGGLATTTHAAGANFLSTLRHATDCTAITDGVDGEMCWEADANTIYVCEPSAGGCDTAGEWTKITDNDSGGTPAWEALINSADSATSYTADNTAETFTETFSAAFSTGAQHRIQGTGAFTGGILFEVDQNTGNPTTGTLVDFRAADTDVTVFRAGDGTNGITLSQAGALTAEGTGTITATAVNCSDCLNATQIDETAAYNLSNTSNQFTGALFQTGNATLPSAGEFRWGETDEFRAIVGVGAEVAMDIFDASSDDVGWRWYLPSDPLTAGGGTANIVFIPAFGEARFGQYADLQCGDDLGFYGLYVHENYSFSLGPDCVTDHQHTMRVMKVWKTDASDGTTEEAALQVVAGIGTTGTQTGTSFGNALLVEPDYEGNVGNTATDLRGIYIRPTSGQLATASGTVTNWPDIEVTTEATMSASTVIGTKTGLLLNSWAASNTTLSRGLFVGKRSGASTNEGAQIEMDEGTLGLGLENPDTPANNAFEDSPDLCQVAVFDSDDTAGVTRAEESWCMFANATADAVSAVTSQLDFEVNTVRQASVLDTGFVDALSGFSIGGTQIACGDLSDSGTLCTSSTDFEEESQLGTTDVSDNAAADQVLRGTAVNTADWTALANGALSYNTTTDAFGQAACSDLSDSGTLCTSSTDFEEEAQLGTTNVSDNAADDQLLRGTAANTADWVSLSNGAVTYNTTTNAFAQAGIADLASSTSADLRTVLSDDIGTGAAMFGLISSMSDDLGCTGSQVVRRNAGDTAFECATVSGGGAPTDATYLVQTANGSLTAEQVATAGPGISINFAGGDGGAATFSFDFSDAGANPALGVDETIFTSNVTVPGYLVFEGDTADGVETRIAVTDPTTTDKTFLIPDADTIAAQSYTCTNQFATALNGTTGATTCTTATLASAQFANQGTTTTVLHGNAGGNPSFGSVVPGDMDLTAAYAFSNTSNTFVAADYTDGSGAAAGSGVFRCANNVACMAAEASPAGTDITITLDASEQWNTNANALIVDNNADAAAAIAVDSGATTAQASSIIFRDQGSDIWILQKPNTNQLLLIDVQNGNLGRLAINDATNGNNTYRADGTGSHVFQSETTTTATINSSGQVCPGSTNDTCLGRAGASIFDGNDETWNNLDFNEEATGNDITRVIELDIDAAWCDTTAGLNWDAVVGTGDTKPTAACNDTGSIQRPSADFSGSAVNSVERTFTLPTGWTGNVDVELTYVSVAASPTGNVEWDLSTVCRAAGETWDGTFNAIQTITDAVAAQNVLNAATQATLTMTGCAAKEQWTLKISRDGVNDTNNDLAKLVKVFITLRAVR